MKRPPLPEMTIDELVRLFADISVAQGEATDAFRSTKANRLTLRQFAVRDELASRADGALAALSTLFIHPNAWVRYNAANSLLYDRPEAARPIIQAIVDTKEFPIAGHAGMTLSFFDGELRGLGTRRLKTDATPSSSA